MSQENSPVAPAIGNPLKSINRFFHAEEVPFGLAIVRILFPWTLIAAHVRRWPHTRELFSLDGATAPMWTAYQTFNNIPQFSGTTMVAAHTAMLLLMVTASIGWFTRTSLLGAAVVYTYLNMIDGVGTITKFSCVATHVLLILAMSHCGDVWSVDAWRKGHHRRKLPWPGEPTADWPRSSIWTRRLVQLALAAVYLGAGITKLKIPGFVTGDQMISWLLSDHNFEHYLGEVLAMNPAWIVVLTYLTIGWEILFPFLCWKGWGRFTMLAIGLGFHIATLLTLGLWIFPTICVILYFAFYDEQDYRMAGYWLRRTARRLSMRPDGWTRWVPNVSVPRFARIPSWTAFGLLVVAVSGLGVLAEHLYDPYGVRRPEGPFALKELSDERVTDLFGPAPPLKDKDIVFTFDVGSTMIGGVLFDSTRKFDIGDTIHAQCFVAPPHDDMWIECNLHDADDRVIERAPLIIGRDSTRGTFSFHVTPVYTPGDYYLVLKKGGQEVSRRKVAVRSDASNVVKAAVAN